MTPHTLVSRWSLSRAPGRRPSSLRIAAVLVFVAQPGWAQGATTSAWTPEVSIGAGLGHVFRFDDQTFGDRPNLTVGVALWHRSRVGLALDVNRTFGLSPAAAACGVLIDGVPAPCEGDAHDGVRAATVASLTALYRIGSGRVQPYVLAGIGVLRSRSVWSLSVVQGDRVVQTEREQRDTGIGPDLGAGLRIGVTPRLSLSPEIRWLEGSARSALNLSVTRVSLRASYGW